LPRGWRRNYRTFSRFATSREATPIVVGATPAGLPADGARAVSHFSAPPPKSAMDQPGSYL